MRVTRPTLEWLLLRLRVYNLDNEDLRTIVINIPENTIINHSGGLETYCWATERMISQSLLVYGDDTSQSSKTSFEVVHGKTGITSHPSVQRA